VQEAIASLEEGGKKNRPPAHILTLIMKLLF